MKLRKDKTVPLTWDEMDGNLSEALNSIPSGYNFPGTPSDGDVFIKLDTLNPPVLNRFNGISWEAISGGTSSGGGDTGGGGTTPPDTTVNTNTVVVRSSNGLFFVYEKVGAASPSISSITLTATLGSSLTTYKWMYKTDSGFVQFPDPSNGKTYVITPDNAVWGNANVLTIRCVSGVYYDEIILYKVYGGSSNITLALTNPFCPIQCSSSGIPLSLENTATDITVLYGGTTLTYDKDYSALSAANKKGKWKFTSILPDSNGSISFNPISTITGSGTITAHTSDITELASDNAFIRYTVEGTDPSGVSFSNITSIQNFSKIKAGAASSGFSITNSNALFVMNGSVIEPTSITLNTSDISAFNLTETTYKWERIDSPYSDQDTDTTGKYTKSYFVVPNTDFEGENIRVHSYKCTVSGLVDGVSKSFSDTITIPRLDPYSGWTIYLNNDITNYTFPSSVVDKEYPDNTFDWSIGICDIRVYFGIDKLKYGESGGSTFSCSVAQGNAVGVTYETSIINNDTFRIIPKGLTSDNAYIDVTVTFRDSNSKATEEVRRIKYSVSRAGTAGQGTIKAFCFKAAELGPDGKTYVAPERPNPNKIVDGVEVTNGNYLDPIALGWQDGIPDTGAPVYMTSRIFTSDGKSPQTNEWTIPQILGSKTYIQFSVDGINPDGWHFEPTPDDQYMRTSSDGITYTGPIKIVGESIVGASAYTLSYFGCLVGNTANDIVKNADDGWDNGYAYSNESYTNGVYCSAKISSTSAQAVFGLDTSPNTSSNTAIDYAWKFTGNGNCEVYIAGSTRATGTFTTGSLFSIVYDGINISFFQDSILKYKTDRAIGDALYFYSVLYNKNTSFRNVAFGPAGTAGADGRSAASLPFSIVNTSVIFHRLANLTIKPASIVLKTHTDEVTIPSPRYQWKKNDVVIPNATGSDYTIQSSDFTQDENNLFKYSCDCTYTDPADNTEKTITDFVNVPRLDDGSSSPNVVLSNENVTFTASSAGYGSITNLAAGKCNVTAFWGGTQLRYDGSDNPAPSTFKVVPAYTGMGITTSVSQDAFTYSVSPASFASDTPFVDLTVTIRNSFSVDTVITKRINYSFARTGKQYSLQITKGPQVITWNSSGTAVQEPTSAVYEFQLIDLSTKNDISSTILDSECKWELTGLLSITGSQNQRSMTAAIANTYSLTQTNVSLTITFSGGVVKESIPITCIKYIGKQTITTTDPVNSSGISTVAGIVGDEWINSGSGGMWSCTTTGAAGVAVWKKVADDTETKINKGLVTTGVLQVGGTTTTGSETCAGINGSISNTPNSDIRFWAGTFYTNRANAAFRVQNDGTLYATKAIISSPTITGATIDGTSSIGGANIGTIANQASNGQTAFDGTSGIRQTGAPNGSLVINSVVGEPTSDGNVTAKITYTYTQGSIQASNLIVYLHEGTGSPTKSDTNVYTDPTSGVFTYIVKPNIAYTFAMTQAKDLGTGGIVETPISSVTASLSGTQNNYTGKINSVDAITISQATKNTAGSGPLGSRPASGNPGDTWVVAGDNIEPKNNGTAWVYTSSNGWVKSSDITSVTLNNGVVTAGRLEVGVEANGIGYQNAGVNGSAGTNPVRFWSGSTFGTSQTAPFRVLNDGTLYATKGNFTGSITGSSLIVNGSDTTVNHIKIGTNGTNIGNTNASTGFPYEGIMIDATNGIRVFKSTEQSPTVSIDTDGTASFKGNITSGSTITGSTFKTASNVGPVTVNGTTTYYAGIIIDTNGLNAYKSGVSSPVFTISATTGNANFVGTIDSGSTITGSTITSTSAINGSTITGGIFRTSATTGMGTTPGSGVMIDNAGFRVFNGTDATPTVNITNLGVASFKGNITSGSTITGSTFRTADNVGTVAGIILNSSGLKAYNGVDTTNPAITISNAGKIFTGVKDSYNNDADGIFLGYDTNSPAGNKLYIGNSNYNIKWTGSALSVAGDIIGTTNIKANSVTQVYYSTLTGNVTISGTSTNSNTTGTKQSITGLSTTISNTLSTSADYLVFVSLSFEDLKAIITTSGMSKAEIRIMIESSGGSTIFSDWFCTIMNLLFTGGVSGYTREIAGKTQTYDQAAANNPYRSSPITFVGKVTIPANTSITINPAMKYVTDGSITMDYSGKILKNPNTYMMILGVKR